MERRGRRASSARGSSRARRARAGTTRREKAIGCHNGSRENIVVGMTDDGRRRARRRRGETASDRPAARAVSSPSPAERARSSRGIGGRTGANLATEGGQLAGAAAQKRRPADGIRAGDARGGGGLLARARGGGADARAREDGRRQGCHVQDARRVGGRALDECANREGKSAGFEQRQRGLSLKIGGKIIL